MWGVLHSGNFRGVTIHNETVQSSAMSFSSITCFVGTLYLFYLSLKLLKFVLDVLKTLLLGGSIDFTKFGSWAVVTGCTDGIGKSYAKQLADKGLNIVLMSRSREKLETVASEIEKEYQVKTKIIQIDFSCGHEIYDGIAKELEGLDIGILVNNVGVSWDHPEYFAETDVEVREVFPMPHFSWKQVNVNILAMTMMTRIIIPAMCKRKMGVVINIASCVAYFPSPLANVYGASKIYMDKFSSNLHYEYADKGIIVQSVLPFFVSSNMSQIKSPSLFAPSADDYVRAVLQKVGVSRMCHGYWPHELQAFIIGCIPQWALSKMLLKYMKDTRAEILRKRKDKSS